MRLELTLVSRINDSRLVKLVYIGVVVPLSRSVFTLVCFPSYFKIYPYSFFGPTTTIFKLYIYIYIYIYIYRRQLQKNAESNIEQVLATTPHKAPTIRPPASHHENYPRLTNQTCRTLLEKQGRAHKWCTPMDPRIWPSKSRTTSSNLHTACEDWECSPEDLPEAMNDREKWQERVRDIHASGTTWWWWWYIYAMGIAYGISERKNLQFFWFSGQRHFYYS